MPNLEMILNGKKVAVEVAPGDLLADVLRNKLGLLGTKVSCEEGECGACTVLIDGQPIASCIYPALKANGREIVTVEGLAGEGRMHPLQQAFVDVNAPQCGYCIPGMLMSAKALLDETPHPDREEIKLGISGNLCRCTGYDQIVDAIQMASRSGEGRKKVHGAIGARHERVDAADKVLGRAKFPGDYNMEGQLYAKVLWTEYPHARVLSLDCAQAAAMPGVVKIITAQDVPVNEYGVDVADQSVLVAVGDVVRWLGDRLAIVIAESPEVAEEACKRIDVGYEPLPLVTDPREAMDPAAPQLHPQRHDTNVFRHVKIRKGDVHQGFEEAGVVVEGYYVTPFQEHAYMQTEAGVGYIDEEGRVAVIVAAQEPHHDLPQLSHLLSVPVEQVREIVPAVGGAFGGREDMFIQHLLALCAYVVRRPVKMVFSREESMMRTGKRHPFYMHYKTGATKAGRLTVLEAELVADGGAYESCSGYVLNAAVTFCAGPYRVPNVRVDGYAVFTNNAVTMAMRGFGANQVGYAYELQMDKLAAALGMDPVELRFRNLLDEGDISITGGPLPAGVGIKATLRQAALEAGWVEQESGWTKPDLGDSSRLHKRRGIGVACGYKNVGFCLGTDDCSKVVVELTLVESGEIAEVLLKSGAADVGMGIQTALVQIAAEALGVDFEKVRIAPVDTAKVPDAGSSSASRQVYITGNAVVNACRMALDRRQAVLREETGETRVVAEYEYQGRDLRKTTFFDPETGMCNPHISLGYASQVALVEVDTETGDVDLLRFWTAQDVGKAINPDIIRGQAFGGVHMGVGYALSEEYVQENAVAKTRRFSEYFIPTAMDMPAEMYSYDVEVPDPTGPFGAKGVGEMATLPTAPAIVAAIHDATGVWIDSLPATAEKIWRAMGEAHAGQS